MGEVRWSASDLRPKLLATACLTFSLASLQNGVNEKYFDVKKGRINWLTCKKSVQFLTRCFLSLDC